MSVIFRVIGWDSQRGAPALGSLGAIEAAPVIIGHCLPRVGDILEMPDGQESKVVEVFHRLYSVAGYDGRRAMEWLAEEYGITQWLDDPPENWKEFLRIEIVVAAVPVKGKR